MQLINAVCIDFVNPKRRAAKETTIQSHSSFGMANIFDLLPKVTTSKDLKYGLKHRSKKKPLKQTNGHLNTDPSHLALHTEKSNFTLHVVSI